MTPKSIKRRDSLAASATGAGFRYREGWKL